MIDLRASSLNTGWLLEFQKNINLDYRVKFHKSLYLFFAVFFMMTKVGFAFNLHFCGDRLASVTTMFEKQGCSMEMAMEAIPSCESEQLTKPGCCSDEILLVQNQDENPLSDISQLSEQQVFALAATIFVLQTVTFEALVDTSSQQYTYTAHAPPLYKLYCAHTFYG